MTSPIQSRPSAARSSWWMRAIVSMPLSHTRRCRRAGARASNPRRGTRGCRPAPRRPRGRMHTKRAPRIDGSSSNQSTSGTGTVPSAWSACITCTCVSKAVAGNTVWPVGSTRMTSGWTSPSQVASKRSVSFEKPDRPGMLTSPTSTASAPVCAPSQPAEVGRAGRPGRAPSRLPSACDPPGASTRTETCSSVSVRSRQSSGRAKSTTT